MVHKIHIQTGFGNKEVPSILNTIKSFFEGGPIKMYEELHKGVNKAEEKVKKKMLVSCP